MAVARPYRHAVRFSHRIPLDRHRLPPACARSGDFLREQQIDPAGQPGTPRRRDHRLRLRRHARQASAHRTCQHPAALMPERRTRFHAGAQHRRISRRERRLHRGLEHLGRIILGIDRLRHRARGHRFAHPRQQPRALRCEIRPVDVLWRIDLCEQRPPQRDRHPARGDRRTQAAHQCFEEASVGAAEGARPHRPFRRAYDSDARQRAARIVRHIGPHERREIGRGRRGGRRIRRRVGRR